MNCQDIRHSMGWGGEAVAYGSAACIKTNFMHVTALVRKEKAEQEEGGISIN